MAAEHGHAIVPVYLGGFWGSVFSYSGGRFFWKIPRRVPYRCRSPSAGRDGQERRAAGPPGDRRAGGAGQQPQRADVPAAGPPVPPRLPPQLLPLEGGRHDRRHLSGGRLLAGGLVLRKLLCRNVLEENEPRVGLLLPPSVGAVLVNAALALDRRVAVNLNYTLSSSVLNDCIRQCGIRRVITSRRVLERFPLKLEAETVFLEDFQPLVRPADKLRAC